MGGIITSPDTGIQRGPLLHIEDDEECRDLVREQLAQHELSVTSLDGGEQALKYLKNRSWNWQPWVIITDILLSGIGGYQLMRRIQEMYPRGEVLYVVLSKLTSPIDIGEAEVAGASAYVSKSSPLDELVAAIKEVTEAEKKDYRKMLVKVPLVTQRAGYR